MKKDLAEQRGAYILASSFVSGDIVSID